MDDDILRELEPYISDHPFQPGAWPDVCGYIDELDWTCGFTRAEHTHISGSEQARCHPDRRCLAVCATAAFVDGRGSRRAAGRTPPAGDGVPAA
jgi:hypothetical protein